ncbi:SU10 major capsid protein [Ensifer canadensis]
MPTLTTTNAAHVREDLADIISMISPEATPFTSAIGKSKATQKTHEWTQDELASVNKDNAAAEGADAADATLVTPTRLRNEAQIFTKTVAVSDTFEASSTVGAKSELARQLMKAGKEIKRDIEAAFVSANPSVSAGVRKLGGAEAWIKTNALHGANGVTVGYAGGNVGAVTAGTPRAFTEALLKPALQGAFDKGGEPSYIMVPPALKVKFGMFDGGATKQTINDGSKVIFAGADIYNGDFGVYSVLTNRWMSGTTVIAFDKELWNQAVLRGVTKKELAKTGDSTKYQLVTEVTLECLNEAGNAKIADLNNS